MFDDNHLVKRATAASASATAAITAARTTTVDAGPPWVIASTTRPASTGVVTVRSALTTLIATNQPSLRWWRAENRQIRDNSFRSASARRSPSRAWACRYSDCLATVSILMRITVKPEQLLRSKTSLGAYAIRRPSSGKMAGMDSATGGMASPRVLVVDDDPDVLASLERGLRLSGFTVSTAVDGAEALRSATETRPDAIVLDINMPVLDGVSVVTALRAMDNDVPVCVLSARSSVDDRVAGLEAGADDYLVKPFVLQELVARVKALLRRRGASATFSSETIQVGPLEVDIPGRRARVNGVDVDLTKREFDLLAVLAEHKTAVLSRAQLLELVWGYDFAADTNVVDVFIGYLRRKLEAGGAPRLLHTVRGVGFVLRTQ